MKYILNTDISSEEETAGSVIDKGDGESIIQDIIVDYSNKVLDVVDLNSSSTYTSNYLYNKKEYLNLE